MNTHCFPDALHVSPIVARAVMPDDGLLAAYLSDDPDEFWAVYNSRFPDNEEGLETRPVARGGAA